jgi:hypothetical protein
MAHFAELNSSNEVLRVIVISNDDVAANGGDLHADAETFVASIVPHSTGGTAWKQTSYNSNFRKQYAGIGFSYNPSIDKFIQPQLYSSWSLDSDGNWQAPVTYPSVTEISSLPVMITWDESNLRWEGETIDLSKAPSITYFVWNASSKAWSEV